MRYNTKTNKKTKFIVTLIILTILLVTVAVLMPILNRTSLAYASTNDTPAIFMRTRRGVRNSPGDDRGFACFDFQRNEANFHHIEAYEFANLLDNEHNSTLRHQSNTITSVANRGRISNVPLLTIITHGQGGQAADWSKTVYQDILRIKTTLLLSN